MAAQATTIELRPLGLSDPNGGDGHKTSTLTAPAKSSNGLPDKSRSNSSSRAQELPATSLGNAPSSLSTRITISSFLKVLIKILIACAGLAATYVMLSLALWTSRKDYRDDCRSQNTTNGALSSKCQAALAKPLSPPPFIAHRGTHKRGEEQIKLSKLDCNAQDELYCLTMPRGNSTPKTHLSLEYSEFMVKSSTINAEVACGTQKHSEVKVKSIKVVASAAFLYALALLRHRFILIASLYYYGKKQGNLRDLSRVYKAKDAYGAAADASTSWVASSVPRAAPAQTTGICKDETPRARRRLAHGTVQFVVSNEHKDSIIAILRLSIHSLFSKWQTTVPKSVWTVLHPFQRATPGQDEGELSLWKPANAFATKNRYSPALHDAERHTKEYRLDSEYEIENEVKRHLKRECSLESTCNGLFDRQDECDSNSESENNSEREVQNEDTEVTELLQIWLLKMCEEHSSYDGVIPALRGLPAGPSVCSVGGLDAFEVCKGPERRAAYLPYPAGLTPPPRPQARRSQRPFQPFSLPQAHNADTATPWLGKSTGHGTADYTSPPWVGGWSLEHFLPGPKYPAGSSDPLEEEVERLWAASRDDKNIVGGGTLQVESPNSKIEQNKEIERRVMSDHSAKLECYEIYERDKFDNQQLRCRVLDNQSIKDFTRVLKHNKNYEYGPQELVSESVGEIKRKKAFKNLKDFDESVKYGQDGILTPDTDFVELQRHAALDVDSGLEEDNLRAREFDLALNGQSLYKPPQDVQLPMTDSEITECV
ncbi:MAG: hypothetical protein Q9227_009204 [Pyrenula ochraceoflavens]